MTMFLNPFYGIDADDLFARVVRDCTYSGAELKGTKDESYELMYFTAGVENPRARILNNPHRPLNPIVAAARAVWLCSGNNRLEDIAYYEPKVRGFTDDGLTVPGSDYGLRLFQPRPGLNQLRGVCDRLSEDLNTRQAAAVVWQPEDAVRDSADIPCTFGMFFHFRHGQLDACVAMRSNNAFRILPFNIFEFTLIHEMVATEIQVPLGKYTVFAASMHVYKNEREWPATVEVADDFNRSRSYTSTTMAPMPTRVSPFEQMNLVARFEARLRHAATYNDFMNIWGRAYEELSHYWYEFLAPLACWIAAKHVNWTVPISSVNNNVRGRVQALCDMEAEAHGA